MTGYVYMYSQFSASPLVLGGEAGYGLDGALLCRMDSTMAAPGKQKGTQPEVAGCLLLTWARVGRPVRALENTALP